MASLTKEKVKEKWKEKGKEKAKSKTDVNPSEDALTIGDMVSKAKTTESKSKIDSKKILINHRFRYRALALFL